MEDESPAASLRLMTFISEEQLDLAKKTRGERAEDGTAQRDRPLFEILKDNKDRKDAEFSERFKHRPPKALDEDETEFLDNLEMSRREYERQVADEDAQQLRIFQEAVAAHSSVVLELKETPTIPRTEEHKPMVKREWQHARPGNLIISVKRPGAKKAKTDDAGSDKSLGTGRPSPNGMHYAATVSLKPPNGGGGGGGAEKGVGGLVSYSDDDDDDDDD